MQSSGAKRVRVPVILLLLATLPIPGRADVDDEVALDQIVVTAKKGKKKVTRIYPV